MPFTTINKSTDHFSSNLYTGTGSALTVTTGHQSDFIWIKQRTTVRPHCLFDSVNSSNFAGGNSKYLVSNTAANLTSNNSTQITANSSTGFTIGTDNSDQINNNGDTAVAWSWKANGAGSANTDGDINSTVSVNTTSGFSIVKYTGNGSSGATVGHGLGKTVKMVIVKDLTNGQGWKVWHTGMTDGYTMSLNTTTAQNTDTNRIASANATTFTTSGTYSTNESGEDYIAYCFAEVQGFSKIGSYVGNGQGNANGSFIYTGFKPSFVFIRNIDFASNWNNFTGKIPGYNQINDILQPNRAAAENGTFAFDMLSNGFKHRSGDVMDRNGDTHIYMAIAEAPLVGTNNVPANAR